MIAGASIWSTSRCTTGRTRVRAGRDRFVEPTPTRPAARARSKRCVRSAVVELERPDQRLQHELRDAADLAALQAPVVIRADPGQRRDLLAPQAGHPPRAEGGQAGLLRRDLRPRVARNSAMS